jgi:organic hydroperoxide reductase OsmC/OhrA
MAATALGFPHRYQVNATAEPEGEVLLLTDGPPRPLRSLPPSAFGGPGDRWSPETLLVGAVADCYVLTFRAMARAAKLPWRSLECEADGTLDRIDKATQFTGFEIRAYLRIPPGTSKEDAHRVLVRAKDNCLVSHSLKAPCGFVAHVDAAESTEAA